MDSHFAHYFGDMTSIKINSEKKTFPWNTPSESGSTNCDEGVLHQKCTAASGKALPLKITL